MSSITESELVKHVENEVGVPEPATGVAIVLTPKPETRCTGNMPCSNCLGSGIDCVYAQARRDRLRLYAAPYYSSAGWFSRYANTHSAMDKNQTLADLLRNLSLRVDDEDRQRIEDALDDVRILVLALSTTRHGTLLTHIPPQLDYDLVSQGTSSTRRQGEKRSHRTVVGDEAEEKDLLGETHVGGSVGSNEELDSLDEDLTRSADARAAGYFGKNSDVQWLSSVQRQTERMGAELRDQPYGPPGSSSKSVRARSHALHERRKNASAQPAQSSIKDSTFWLDNEDIDLGFVNPFEQPEPETAERLFGYYLKTIHSSYPLVSSPSGTVTYHRDY
jgi:hypothetical protein